MRRNRHISGLCALLSLAALVNAQSMACCWKMARPENIAAKAGMASNHSCCHKAPVSAGEQGLSQKTGGVSCDGTILQVASPVSPDVSNFAFAPSSFLPFFIPVPPKGVKGMERGSGGEVYFGPPVYLLTLRLLI